MIAPTNSTPRVEQILGGAGLVAALLAFAGSRGGLADEAVRGALFVVQLVAVIAWLRGAERAHGWVSSGFVLAAAWAAIFVLPCTLYVLKPSLFGPADLTGTVAAVTAFTALAALIYVAVGGSAPQRDGAPAVSVLPGRIAWRVAFAGYALGLAALALLVVNAGGPVAYLSNLDETAGANAGLWYVVAVLMLLRWVPAAVMVQRWSTGQPAGRLVIAAYVIGTLLLTLTGARLFLALAVLEAAMLWSLLVRPIPLRRVLGVGLLVGLLVVFGLGTVKRYQSATSNGSVDQSFLAYATSTAPREAVDAYVNNYVDTVRLIGLARGLVPRFAPYEGLRPLEELALKPLPSGIRPELPRNEFIRLVFAPAGATAYAVPLQANALLAGGLAAALAVTALLALLVAAVDRAFSRVRRLRAWQLVAFVVTIIEVPMVVRSGVPNGVATALTDIIGSTATAWLVVRGVHAAAATTAEEAPA